jgi:hypothetical protein
MRAKRKRQVTRHRPVSYRRGRDIYGVEYVLVGRTAEAPQVKALTGKKGREDGS